MQIDSLNYVQFISLLQETNRPPGGKHTVRYWITNAHISRHSRVLDVGSNTGFTSLELARSAKCNVVGIDVAQEAIDVARSELSRDVESVQQRISFECADVCNLPFKNEHFDVVVCGGALSFVAERRRALSEIQRVLAPWGFLCVSPLCYRDEPPQTVLASLRAILGFDVPRLKANDWVDLLSNSGFEIYATRTLALAARGEDQVVRYVDQLVDKAEIELDALNREALRKRAKSTYLVFNENHRYLEAALGVYRKRHLPEEIELFGVRDWI